MVNECLSKSDDKLLVVFSDKQDWQYTKLSGRDMASEIPLNMTYAINVIEKIISSACPYPS